MAALLTEDVRGAFAREHCIDRGIHTQLNALHQLSNGRISQSAVIKR
jgi:hypothetical protein